MEITPTIGVWYKTFKRECEKNGTMQTWQELRKKWKACQNAVAYKWDNEKIRLINIFGESFAIYVNKSNNFITLTMWNENGHVSLDSYSMEENGFAEGEFKRIVETMDNWGVGLVPCSKCGKFIDYQVNKNHNRYAGIYCRDCWNEI